MTIPKVPISIRSKNPGAQWPSKSSRKFGSYKHWNIRDGNKIAVFATYEEGAAALFDLLDRVYTGLTIADAIKKWSGNNNVNSYLAVIEKHTPFKRTDYIDTEFVETPEEAIPFAKAMAWHEAGREYPLDQDGWERAHDLFLRMKRGEKPDIEVANSKPVFGPMEWALGKVGEREIPGPEDNAFIVQCFHDVGREEVLDDETPWCAAFVGAALKNSDAYYLHGNLLAREYLNYGIELSQPEVGAIVVFKRGSSSWQGHVAFVSDVTATEIEYVGGNQANAVTVERMSRKDDRILGYRRPIPRLLPVPEVVADRSVRYKAVGILATLTTLVWDGWIYIVDGVAYSVDFVAVAVGALPEVAREASSATRAGETIAESAGLPWPATAALVITLAAIAFNLVETWNRKRTREGNIVK